VDRARTFGLLPEPDQGGSRPRWSAALADDIRDRWPEIAAAARCIGAAALTARGWTEAMIRDLLGPPDLRVDNPHHKRMAPMRLWRLQRAEAIEDSPAFAWYRPLTNNRTLNGGSGPESRRDNAADGSDVGRGR
jgi:hypothetical protein